MHQVQVATKRGICFELCYSNALRDPSSRRHLFAAAQSLSLLTGCLIMSSGALDALQTRNPHDVMNLCSVLGMSKTTSSRCLSKTPVITIEKGKLRKSNRNFVIEHVSLKQKATESIDKTTVPKKKMKK
jgi:RNase P/RNase MRP subunit p30